MLKALKFQLVESTGRFQAVGFFNCQPAPPYIKVDVSAAEDEFASVVTVGAFQNYVIFSLIARWWCVCVCLL